MDDMMAELSSHSYHYDRNSIISVPEYDTNESDVIKQTKNALDSGNEENDKKKKSRRRKRMLTGVSKQRRAANERERKRLKIINEAFKDLKEVLPLFPEENSISKIEIVRLASRTITYLSDLLKDSDNVSDMPSPRGSVSSEGSLSSFSESAASTSSEIEPDLSSPLSDTQDLASFLLFSNNDGFNSNTNFSILAEDIKEDVASNNGFSGLDINCFIRDNYNDIDDVFPSMIFS